MRGLSNSEPGFFPHSTTAVDIAPEREYSLRHLYAELARLDVLIRREVQRWQLAGQDPGDIYRGLYISDDQAEALLAREAGSNCWHQVLLEPAEMELYCNAYRQASDLVERISHEAHAQGITPRFERLADVFNLDCADVDILLICLASNFDLRYERLFGYLHDDLTRKRPSVNLILDLLCKPGYQRQVFLDRISITAPLIRERILSLSDDTGPGNISLLNRSIFVDETIVQWLMGHYYPSSKLGTRTILSHPAKGNEEDFLIEAKLSDFDLSPDSMPILGFYGPDQARQTAAARYLAARCELPLLSIDLSGVVEMEGDLSAAIRLALRDSRLTNALLFLSGWDSCLVDGSPPPDLLSECCAHPGPLILASQCIWQPSAVQRIRHMHWIEFPIPPFKSRLAIWKHYLGSSESIEENEIVSLAGQFQLTSTQIRDAFLSAKDVSAQEGRQIEPQDLFNKARLYSTTNLSGLAHKLIPRYCWEDIVLPDDQIALLHEIVLTICHRPIVLDEWGIGRKLVSSRGVTVLFSGPPGTGKTMAAEVIAKELSLDLFKIDLSTIVSKYIGETEKNLERIFTEAENSSAILFFDEADALFGKRSEVRDSHDRYANIEISYLLQRMEAYDGVTILATNLRSNLDEAFTRRLQFSVDFPFPEVSYRQCIWKTLFPAEVPRANDLDLQWLAERFKLSGGNIRNIIVSAAYLAASDGGEVRMEHLLHGVRRELQKMGRLVGEGDFLETVR
jgi:AAA+ superfamily predicted ATPase